MAFMRGIYSFQRIERVSFEQTLDAGIHICDSAAVSLGGPNRSVAKRL
jgi:hypothetical protein